MEAIRRRRWSSKHHTIFADLSSTRVALSFVRSFRTQDTGRENNIHGAYARWQAETSVGWLFNGTSTQKGQFVGRETSSVGKRWPTEYNAYYLTIHDNNVTQCTVKHSKYINATTGYPIDIQLLNITLVPSPMGLPSHTPCSMQFHSVWMQFYVTIRTHVCVFVHVAECHSTISWTMSSYFPMAGFKAT